MTATDVSGRFVVTGRVQGVGFRWFVRRRARELGLAGWTENAPDGTVLVVASGPAAGLDQLLRDLRVGPPGARVDRVERGPDPSLPDLPRPFQIR